MVLFIFVVEIVIEMNAEGRAPLRYFKDPWTASTPGRAVFRELRVDRHDGDPDLFIGVIMTGMDEAQAEQMRDAQAEGGPSLADELADVEAELAKLHHRLGVLQRVAR